MRAKHCQRMQVQAHSHLPTALKASYPYLPRSWMASSNLFSSMAFCTSFVLKRKGSRVVHTQTQPVGLEKGLLAITSMSEAQEAYPAPDMRPPLLGTNQSRASLCLKPLRAWRALGMGGFPSPPPSPRHITST